MIKALGAAVLAAHGLIHLIGFVVPWRIAAVEGFPYRTTALDGILALGDTGTRLVGIAWLVLAIGFVVAAAATWRGEAWARALAAGLAAASIVVCGLGLPEAVAGVAVNIAILAVLAWTALGRGAAAGTPG
jgi:predicted cation transporter